MAEDLVEKVREALKEVVDPEIGANVVDVGFVRDIRVNNGIVEIDMMLTTPFCPLMSYLISSVESAARSVEGVKDVKVNVVGFGIPPELEELIRLQRGF